MRTEIKRMLSGRNFWAAVFLGVLGIGFGAVYPKLGEELLPAWNFLSMEKKAFYSETACFFVPLAAVLPWRMEGRFSESGSSAERKAGLCWK